MSGGCKCADRNRKSAYNVRRKAENRLDINRKRRAKKQAKMMEKHAAKRLTMVPRGTARAAKRSGKQSLRRSV